jgi:hypothetical protein
MPMLTAQQLHSALTGEVNKLRKDLVTQGVEEQQRILNAAPGLDNFQVGGKRVTREQKVIALASELSKLTTLLDVIQHKIDIELRGYSDD